MTKRERIPQVLRDNFEARGEDAVRQQVAGGKGGSKTIRHALTWLEEQETKKHNRLARFDPFLVWLSIVLAAVAAIFSVLSYFRF